MKVLSGVHPHGEYTGDIVFDGKTQVFHGIADSEKVGIAIIYQELALVPDMTVYENIFLGHEISPRDHRGSGTRRSRRPPRCSARSGST